MKWNPADRRSRANIVALIILLAGLSSAALIYLTAVDTSENSLVSQFQNSKRYNHDLELIGGKANVLADKFYRWFASLWQGETLAFTIACLSIIIAAGVYFVGYLIWLDSEIPPDEKEKDKIGLKM